jgi:pimeloyl-ACP methyl ester carboxylesterase
MGPQQAPVVHTWNDVLVDRAVVRVMEAGDPLAAPLLFLHGWGLSPACYADGVSRLTSAGVRVLAPCLPGFGGSDPLPLHRAGLADYAHRITRLLEVLGEDGPVFVAAHSFGGGIALQLATERPDLVRSLTLVNPVGGDALPSSPAEWLSWAAGAVSELTPASVARSATSVLRAFLPNLLRAPFTLASSARLALTASLADQARSLVLGGVPVLFVWSDDDRLVAPGSLAGVVAQLPAQVVHGRHGWLLTEPAAFAELVRNALVVHAMLERRTGGRAVVVPAGRSLSELLPAAALVRLP